MAEYTIIKLTNLSPLHIGTGKENYDFSAAELQSDTLTAALAAMRVQIGNCNELDKFLKSFSLSSACPFIENSFFLPRMQGKLRITVTGKDEYEYRKKLKSIQFIDIKLWMELIKGNSINVDEKQLQGNLLFAADCIKDRNIVYKSHVSERVSVPRGEGEPSDPFFFDWKYFSKGAGLFCLTDATGKLLQQIIDLFHLLGEWGIGTDRSVGGGKFDVESDKTLHIDSVNDANATLLLSLYIPTEEELAELNLKNSKYSILHRGGYMAGSQKENFRHLRKKSIYMFGVGSIFNTTVPLEGKIVDLKPEWNDPQMHPVYRSGKPFSLQIKI